MTLEEAIDQFVALGHKDADEIDRLVTVAYGEDQVRDWAVERAHDLICQTARARVSQVRRSNEVALESPDKRVAAKAREDLPLQGMYVPDEEGIPRLVRYADATVDDFRKRAQMYDRLGVACFRRRDWILERVEEMLERGCGTFGELAKQVAIPPLPPVERMMIAA